MRPRRSKTLSVLQGQLPAGELRFDSDILQRHSGDKWFASGLPDAVALPRTTRSVAAILRFAQRHRIPAAGLSSPWRA